MPAWGLAALVAGIVLSKVRTNAGVPCASGMLRGVWVAARCFERSGAPSSIIGPRRAKLGRSQNLALGELNKLRQEWNQWL